MISAPSVRRGVASGADGLKNSCSIEPSRRTVSGSPSSAAALARTASSAPAWEAMSSIRSAVRCRSETSPAAVVTGFPLNVPEW